MNVSLMFRDQLTGPLEVVGAELEQLVAALNVRIRRTEAGLLTFSSFANTGSTTSTVQATSSSSVLVADTDASHNMRITCGSDLTAQRDLEFRPSNIARIITINGNPTLNNWFDQDVRTTAAPSFSALTTSGASGIRATNATGGIGYGTGAGGTVTQLTDKATTVILNTATGNITMNAAALAGDTTVSFTLTNSAIAATDLLLIWHVSAGTVGSYTVTATPAAGSASIVVRNVTAGSLSEAIVLKFAVFKAVTA